MTSRLRATDYQAVLDIIQARTGLRVNNGRFDAVARVIDEVLASMHLAGVNSLVPALTGSAFTDPLWQTLIQALTVGETYFYRDQAHFEALRTHILPRLIAERRKTGNKVLRLWSAGCATGEEPYSLAMLLHELLPDIETWHITLLGTDINLAFLERARHGVYRPSSFRRETPKEIQKHWFTATPEGYRLHQAIRDTVIFSSLNLAESSPSFLGGTLQVDLIMCRNVTIYFDQVTTINIIGRFYRALADEGWLVVGHAETLSTMYRGFNVCNFEKAVFYQKAAASTAVSLAAPPQVIVPPPILQPAPQSPARVQDYHQQSAESAWAQVKAAADSEKWDEALAHLAQIETEHLLRPEFHYLQGLIQMAAENAEKALWALRQAVYCDPTFALAHYSLGELHERRGEYKLAIRHWRHALAALAELEPQLYLPFADGLTVEMLQGLLMYRLDALVDENDGGRRDVLL
jgi:chemotaxis protein methyltransferase CheR